MSSDDPGVIPMLSYSNGIAALEWLADAFGFRERTRMTDAGGRLTHAEMHAGSGLIMLATPTTDYEGPAQHRGHCTIAAAWSRVPYVIDGVLVYVDDLDAHSEHARAAGATILSEPERTEHGALYRAEDLEGHRWMFMQR